MANTAKATVKAPTTAAPVTATPKGTAVATAAPASNAAPATVANQPPAPHLGKYTGSYVKTKVAVTAMPSNWARGNTTAKLGVAPASPRNPQQPTVFGVLYGLAQVLAKQNGGNVPVAQLFAAMCAHTWAGHHKTKYTANGLVCGQWVKGYINGAFSAKHGHLVAQ